MTMLLAAAILTWMILWMGVQGRQVQLGLEREVEAAALRRQASAIFVVAFLAVVREGIETALFLSAAAFQDEQTTVVLGGLAGIATACALGWGLYRATIRLNVRRFFQVTGCPDPSPPGSSPTPYTNLSGCCRRWSIRSGTERHLERRRRRAR
jgi:high-affinity iron transporter